MSKAVPILTVLLVVQIALAVGFKYADHLKANAAGKKLIEADLSKVDQIVLEKKGGKEKVVLRKTNDNWTLPDHYNFGASKESVDRLIEKLKGLSAGWPVATTDDAASRFKVAGDDFEERVVLKSGNNDLATALIGSSAGFNKVHLRLDKHNEIYSVEIPSKEVSTSFGDWIDREAVAMERDDIQEVVLPQLTLARKGKEFEISYDGKSAPLDSGSAGEVLENVAGVSISAVLGIDEKPEYGLSEPVLTYSVSLKNKNVLNYRFGKLKDTNFYVLKKPVGDAYLKIDSWFVDRIRELSPAALVAKSEQLRKLKESATKNLIDKAKEVPKP